MAKVKIYGASDDLIEIEGDMRDELCHSGDEPVLLGFSDGTILRVWYDEDGIWRIIRVSGGSATFTHEPGDVEADRVDVAHLEGDIRWCVMGSGVIRA